MKFPLPESAGRSVLRKVLDSARLHGARGVAVFDLDSTLLDNKPRQARIFREYGALHGVEELTRLDVGHFTCGWDLKAPLRAVGLGDEWLAAHFGEARLFWREHFFSGRYCTDDRPIEGAVAFVRRIREAGATVAYCTGRHEGMREGTLASLQQCGFPEGTLIMKPTLEAPDDEYKRLSHERLRALGRVIAAFDNEPTHINDYHLSFPDALVVHLATDHSGREVQVHPEIRAVADFTLP